MENTILKTLHLASSGVFMAQAMDSMEVSVNVPGL